VTALTHAFRNGLFPLAARRLARRLLLFGHDHGRVWGLNMDDTVEIIALVLGDANERRWRAGQLGRGAQCLVRRSDGRVALEPVASEEEFEKTARTTGCFRRGKPIHDPYTHEVIGYEMEQVPLLRSTSDDAANNRSREI
jgi:hypothetical protein